MAEVKWYGAKVFADINKSMDKVNNAVALDVRNEAIASMRGPKSGREYRVPGTQKTYTASAPGEAPAIQFGTLRSSIIVEFIAQNHRRVGTNMVYARRLELGDRGPDKRGVTIKARPYLRPALDKATAKVGGHIRDERL